MDITHPAVEDYIRGLLTRHEIVVPGETNLVVLLVRAEPVLSSVIGPNVVEDLPAGTVQSPLGYNVKVTVPIAAVPVGHVV